MEYFRQCKFKQGDMETIAWIPEHGAKIGFSMIFTDDKNSGRWEVVEVGQVRMLKENLNRSNVFESIKK